MREFWVFGYGSLMWKPGFAYEEMVPARICGYHRTLCVLSHVHRGTPAQPGLVLGLDRGGACRGVAFRIAPALADETLQYLRERELVTQVYREVTGRALLLDGSGRHVSALMYVVDQAHEQYAGKLTREAQLGYVRQGHGISGANPDYVTATQAHLETMGIHDPALSWLSRRLREA